MKSDSRERRNGLRMSHPEVSREATMGPELIRGGVAESQVGVDLDSGVFGAGQHGGNLRLPLRRSVDTLRTLLCDDLHPQRPPKPVKFSRTDSYWTVSAVGKKGSHWALDEEVIEVKAGTGETALALTPEAVAIGDVRLVIQKVLWDSARLHDFLGQWIYRDETFLDFIKSGLLGGVVVFLVALALAIPKDSRRARERKEGRRLKGPELVTARKFNRRNRSDGIGFDLTKRTLIHKAFGKVQRLVLPRDAESSHILIMGDTGMGKSTLIRQILLQVEARGDTAIVYDPALEYTPKFYKPERGDIILNPIDQRMPYWSPSDELTHVTESSTLAASLFPHRHNENAFFTEGPRKIFAHLLTFRPTPEELAWWICHDGEIDQ